MTVWSKGVASPSEIPVPAVLRSPHAARVVYEVANTAAVGIVHDAVSERNARAGNEQWPEVDLGQVLVSVLGVLQLVMKETLMKQPRTAGPPDYQLPTAHYVRLRASHH
jgi:hypothetical protein